MFAQTFLLKLGVSLLILAGLTGIIVWRGQQIKVLRAEKSALESELATLRGNLDSANFTIAKLQESIENYEAMAEATQNNLRDAIKRNRELQRRIDELKASEPPLPIDCGEAVAETARRLTVFVREVTQ